MKLFALFLFIGLVFSFTNCLNILIGYAPAISSHLRSTLPLIKKLVEKNHNVTLFQIQRADETVDLGVNISVIKCIKQITLENSAFLGSITWKMNFHFWLTAFAFPILLAEHRELSKNCTKQIAEAYNNDWDIIISGEIFNFHMFAFAAKFSSHNVPYILFSPSSVVSFDAYTLSTGQSWAATPNMFGHEPLHLDDNFDFTRLRNRLLNFVEYATEVPVSLLSSKVLSTRVVGYYGFNHFDISSFLQGSSIFFIDTLESIGFPNPRVNEFRQLTSFCATAKPLPKEYLDFVEDTASKGTIYIAFGTYVTWNFAPEEKRKAFFGALSQLRDFRIIFSYKGDFPENLPSHIRLVKWAPQLDVLAHPKTKVFLTHGGAKSIKEGICSKTPMLLMPVFAEQNRNAKFIVRSGMGLALNKFTIDSEQLLYGLKKVLNNDAYLRRVKKLNQMILDRPMAELDEAEHLIKRIVQRKRAGINRPLFFKRSGIDLNFFQFINAELWIALLLLISIFSKF